MFKQSVSLIVVPAVIALSTGLANAHEVEVKTGNMQVSVQNGEVQVNSNPARSQSWLNRLGNLRIFNGSSSRSTGVTKMKCDRSSSGYSTSRRNSSGTAVSQSSSSSTTMTCN